MLQAKKDQHGRASLFIQRDTRDRLRDLKKELGFRSYDPLLNYMAIEVTKGGAIPPASYELVFEQSGTRPIILTGESGSGKSTTVRSLLESWLGNVFLFDVANEYVGLKTVDLGRFFSLNWKREGQRVRFVPNANLEASRGEAVAVFSHLNFVMHSGGAQGLGHCGGGGAPILGGSKPKGLAHRGEEVRP